MSKEIDERVVSMQFDNKQFESNVSTTMSTLDKLKQKLNFTGASKGLENVNAAANKVNMSGLGNAVESVRVKFSALEVMGVTALANITNSAVNAGKRMVKALTIDPIGDGFKEYEMTLNAVQTTMAGTGKTAKEVEEQLKRLDKYADDTVYSSADMFNNLPKFTNAGVELEKATTAMIGIANATALAGGDASKASIAFYNLGQAIGTGYLTRMDYNSINNAAGITTMEWKKQMVEAAIAAGTLKKVGEDSYQAGKKTLTLQQLFIDGLQEQWATTDVMMKVFGDYGDTTTEIGKKAQAAAQDIKTFSMMMDSLKATAGTGWKDTWQIIFGDLDEAKKFWTGINNFISGIITKFADARNTLLEGAFSNPFQGILDKINNSGLGKTVKTVSNISEAVSKASKGLEYYQNIVNDVWRGDYKNQPYRYDLLDKAGYNHKVIQSLVNKGYKYKLTMEDVNEAEKKFGVSLGKTSKEAEKTSTSIEKLSNKQLKNAGLTDEEIKLYRELEKQSEKTGKSISELLKDMEGKDGRTLLIDSFKNIGGSIVKIINSIKNAWIDIFPPMTSLQLYNIISGLNKFTEKLVISKDTVDNLKRTFKGLFAIIDIIATVTAGPLKIAFKAIVKLLGMFNLNILDITAGIGDVIVKFRDFIDKTLDFTKVFEKIVPGLKNAAKAIKEWMNSLKDSDNIPGDIILGLVNGLKKGISKIAEVMIEIGKTIIDTLKDVLGIHSPSWKGFEIGRDFFLGIIEGLKAILSKLLSFISDAGNKMIEVIKKIDFGAIFSAGISIGFIYTISKLTSALEAFSSPLDGLGEMLEDLGKGAKSALKGIGREHNSKAVLNLAIAVGVLAASIYLLTKVDKDRIWEAVGVLFALSGIIFILSKAASGLGKVDKFGTVSLSLMAIAASLLIVALAIKTIARLDDAGFSRAMNGIGAIGIVMTLLIASTNFSKDDIDNVGNTLLKISGAILILAIVSKMIAKMSWPDIGKVAIVLVGLVTIIRMLLVATRLAENNVDKVGTTLLAIAGAFAILTIVAKIIARMSWPDMGKAAIGLLGLVGIVALLVRVVKIAEKDAPRIGPALLAIAGSMIILTMVAKLLANMSWGDMAKAAVGMMGLVGIIALLIEIVKLVEKDAPKIALTLLAISVSMGILAGIAILLSLIDPKGLAKGIIAITLLATAMSMMIKATAGADNCKGNLIVMTIAIAVMAGAIAALSLIETDKLLASAGSLALVMGMFSLIVKAGSIAKSSMGSLIVMTLAIGLIAGMLYCLSKLPIESTISVAISLSTLLLAMSGALFILSKINIEVKDALMGILALTVMAIPLLAFVYVLYRMQNIQNATNNVIALTILATALTLLLIPLSVVGALIGLSKGATMLGIVALLAMAVPLFAFIKVLEKMQNIQNAMSNVIVLTLLMTVIGDVLFKISLVAPLAVIGVAAMGAMVMLMTAIGGLAVAIGWLMQNDKFSAIQSFLDTGIPILEQLAHAVGSVMGNIIAGFSEAIASSLPQIGKSLSDFMEKVTPFINGVKLMDETAITGAKALAGAILVLTAADFINGITSFLSDGSSFAQLGTDLSTFMKKALPFIAGVNMIDPAAMEGVKSLASIILTLTGSDILDALTSWFTGGSSLTKFGEELSEFAPYIKDYADAVAGIDGKSVEASANAAKALSEVAKNLPNSGGKIAEWLGDNEMDTFGKQMISFGESMKNYAIAVQGLDTKSVSNSVEAAKSISEVADNLPNSGGWVTAFTGDNDIGTFGIKMWLFGIALKNYSVAVQDLNTKSISASVKATKSISEVAENLPTNGGFKILFKGDNDAGVFAQKLISLGNGLKGYSDSVAGINSSDISSSITAIRDLTSVINNMAEINTSGVNSFKKSIDSLSKTNIDGFVNSFSGASSKLASSGSNMMTSLANGIASNKNSAISSVNNVINSILVGVNSKKSEFSLAGTQLISQLASGINKNSSKVKSATSSVVNSASSGIKSGYNDFYNAGSYLVSGFASGISTNTFRAVAKAKAMAAAAEKAAKEELDINSPSKVFRKIGKSVPEGFAMGIGMLGGMVEKSSIGMANTAMDSTRDSLSQIGNTLLNGIDAEPTIRPVVDLSNVRSGANAINNLLNGTNSIRTLSNINSISSMMGSRNQNGDLTSAINKLRKDLGNINNTSYTINGIEFSEGSDVSEAFKTIIRAARIERRV